MRYLQKNDIYKIEQTVARRAVMLQPYIDEEVQAIAWKEGDVLPLIGKIKDGGGYVVRSRKTGMDYVIEPYKADSFIIQKIG